MSISVAPSKIARRVSYCFTSGVVAPSGKPTTEHTPTPVPRSRAAARATQVGFTHTVANLHSAASRHSVSISSARGVGLQQRVIDEPSATAFAPPSRACRPEAGRAGIEHAPDAIRDSTRR